MKQHQATFFGMHGSEEDLKTMLNQENHNIRKEAILHPKLTEKQVSQLSTDPSWSVRYHVAFLMPQHLSKSNPKFVKELFDRLTKDENWGVRLAVAKYSTDLHQLQALSKDEEPIVRETADKNIKSIKK